MTKKKNYENILKKQLKIATPNSHKVKDRKYFIAENGKKYNLKTNEVVLEYDNSEKETAILLENKFGGEIFMNPKINKPEGIKSADYYFQNNNWDKKCLINVTSKKRAIDNILKNNKNQAKRFIIDISHSKLKTRIILKQIKNVFNVGKFKRDWVEEIMVIKKNKILKWYRKK